MKVKRTAQRIFITLLTYLCLTTFSSYAQSDLNGYKYILVPKKFEFQKSNDKYQLNSLTKFLFKKEGFLSSFSDSKKPEDFYNNPCLGLETKVINISGMLTTKLVIELVDCNNVVVFKSNEGRSKLKEFKKAYQEAIRKAFESVKSLNYKYDSSLANTGTTREEVVKEEIIPLVEDVPLQAKVTNANGEGLKFAKVDDIGEEKAEEKKEEISQINNEEEVNTNTTDAILYAQSKSFGYQLVDSTPKVIYLLQKTSVNNLFILKNKNGVVHKKNEKWIAEYYENDQLIRKELKIKF